MNKLFIVLISGLLLVSCTQNSVVSESIRANAATYKTYETGTKNLGDDWIESTAQVEITNITPEEAKEEAIKKACGNALEYYTGVYLKERKIYIIGEDTENVTRDDYIHITDQTTQGIILEKKVVGEQIITIDNAIFSKVTVRVKIGQQKGERDPYFSLDATLNKEHFQEYETLEICCVPSKDCYITILNICSNDTVYVLFPNQYREDNFVKAGDTFEMPNEQDRNIGLSLPVELLPGKITDSEIIKIIATKEKLNLVEFKNDMIYGTFSASLNKLMQRLITIPQDQIVEYDLVYFVHK